MAIVAELVEKGTIVQTPYEPRNGDVMLGLPDNLPVRKAAHEERKKLIACLAKNTDIAPDGTKTAPAGLRPLGGARRDIAGRSGIYSPICAHSNSAPASARVRLIDGVPA